jgi:hypothetical protein
MDVKYEYNIAVIDLKYVLTLIVNSGKHPYPPF